MEQYGWGSTCCHLFMPKLYISISHPYSKTEDSRFELTEYTPISGFTFVDRTKNSARCVWWTFGPRSHEAPQTKLCRFRFGVWLQGPWEVREHGATKDGGQRTWEKEDAGPEHCIWQASQSGPSMGSGQETLEIWNPTDGPELHYGSQSDPDWCQQTRSSSERLAESTVWQPEPGQLFLFYAV